MSGYLLLEGGAEFGGRMADPDRRAIELAGGMDAPLCIIPTAAAPDNNHQRAGQNGVRWFNSLGVTDVTSLPIIDQASANQPAFAARLRDARFIYLLGGFPLYLEQTLAGSLCWQAVLEAYHAGAVFGGSSAGAMVLCQHYYDPRAQCVVPGLNLLPKACIIPHFNTFEQGWAAQLSGLLPDDLLIGIHEQTGMINDGMNGGWNVYGKGVISLNRSGKIETFHPGDTFAF